MRELSEVSKTSILTLICRVVGANKEAYSFNDQKALEIDDLVYASVTKSEKQWIGRLKKKFKGLSRKSVKVMFSKYMNLVVGQLFRLALMLPN